ncbi:MAG: hypothetical protein RLZZ192_1610 [Pseudomonadota bacterium]
MPSKLPLRVNLNPDGTPVAPHIHKDNSAWRSLLREDIIDPQRPIIDAHHHLWDRPGQLYLFPEFIADAKSGHNIRASVFVECGAYYRKSAPEMMDRLGEVEFANGMAAMGASQMYGATQVAAGIVGTADLTYGAPIAALLDAQIAAASERFRGVRLITKWDADPPLNNGRYAIPPGLLGDTDFRTGFAELDKRDLSFDSMIYHHQIPELVSLARAFPNTRIILNHIGGLIAKTRTYLANEAEATEQWKVSMRALAQCPNVYVKLGGLGMSYLGFGFNQLERPAPSQVLAQAWGPLFEYCIEQFGPARCMFESNFPPDRESVDYHVIWNAFKRVVETYSENEKNDLFFGTAARVYRLDV